MTGNKNKTASAAPKARKTSTKSGDTNHQAPCLEFADLNLTGRVKQPEKYIHLLELYQSVTPPPSLNELSRKTGYSPLLVQRFLRAIPGYQPTHQWSRRPVYQKGEAKGDRDKLIEEAYVRCCNRDGVSPSGYKLAAETGYSRNTVANFLWARSKVSDQANTNRHDEAFARLKSSFDKYVATYGKAPSRNKLVKLARASRNTASKFLNSKE